MGYCGPQGHPYNCSMGLRISLSLSIYIYDVMHYMMTSFNYILHGLVTPATAPTFYLLPMPMILFLLPLYILLNI